MGYPPPPLAGSSNTSSWSHVIGEMFGGQHRVDEVTRTEPVGWTGKKTTRELRRIARRRKQRDCTIQESVRKEQKKSQTLLTRPTSLEMSRNPLTTTYLISRLHLRSRNDGEEGWNP